MHKLGYKYESEMLALDGEGRHVGGHWNLIPATVEGKDRIGEHAEDSLNTTPALVGGSTTIRHGNYNMDGVNPDLSLHVNQVRANLDCPYENLRDKRIMSHGQELEFLSKVTHKVDSIDPNGETFCRYVTISLAGSRGSTTTTGRYNLRSPSHAVMRWTWHGWPEE